MIKTVVKIVPFLFASFFISACQPTLVQKGVVVNKTNPNFLKDAGVDEITNPHKDSKCSACHLAPVELLKKEKASANESIRIRQMRTDLINLCSTCHKAAAEAEHSVGKTTKLNKNNLPLDHEGKMTCATTCHEMHTKDPLLSKKMLRHKFDDLCLSCHDV